MGHSSRQFKDTQVYGWDMEPKDERPSEFVPSTGYSVLSGYHVATDLQGTRRPRRRSGINSALVVSLVVIGLGTAALVGFLHLVRG